MELDGKIIFLIVGIIVTVFILVIFCLIGRKALAIFPDINSVPVKYRDKSASGYSTKSIITKMGGSNKVLDIVVTDKELWLKSMILFAGISQYYELLHKIPLNKIISAGKDGRKVILNFKSETGEDKKVVIFTKRPDEFLREIKK